MDARRNSDVSALSLCSSFTTTSSEYSTPPTPMYSRSPLVAVNAFDLSHTHGLPIQLEPKTTTFDESLTSSWVSLDHPSHLSHHVSSVPCNDMFASHGYHLDSQGPTFGGLDNTAIGTTQPWYNTTTYTSLDNHIAMTADMDIGMNTTGLYVDTDTATHPIWNAHTQPMPHLDASTIVPHESMLGGPYVSVDTPDLSAESYDDADEPFPQHDVFKRETASPTYVKSEPGSPRNKGGKTISKEQRDRRKKKTPGQMKVKSSTSWSKDVVWKVDEEGVEDYTDEVYRDEENRIQWANRKIEKKHCCSYPFADDEEVPAGQESTVCGRSFKRPEHLLRHRKIHAKVKDHFCRMYPRAFDRNDNCWAHAFTHVHRPDKKDGRNKKFSLRQVISVVSDPKQIDKLLKDWNTEVKSDYRPEDEEDDSPLFMEEVKKAHPDFDFLYDADEACPKIEYHRMGQ